MRKRFYLIVALAIVCVTQMAGQANGCTGNAKPIISPSPEFYPLDAFPTERVYFSAGNSYDPDNSGVPCCCNGIIGYLWSYSPTGVVDDPSPLDEDPFSCKFKATGKFSVYLKVIDDEHLLSTERFTCSVYIFKMDLDISGVDESIEDTVGKYIGVNDDDDNGNGTPDKDETSTVSNENDLVQISLSYEPSALDTGSVVLKNQGSSLKVWSSATKDSLVVPAGGSKSWSPGSVPPTLYVEAIDSGVGVLQLCFTPGDNVWPGGEKNPDTVKFTGIDVDMLYCYPSIVMYTDPYKSDSPTQYCVAEGFPSGGTYSWECWTTGTGKLEIVSGEETGMVLVKGDVPSTAMNDAKIKVTYTKGGFTVEETRSVTVRRPKRLGKFAGNFDRQYRTFRNYFHPVFDQFNKLIDMTGMPCDEEVRFVYGLNANVTSPGTTGNWPAELDPMFPYGNWKGGVAIKDRLGCPTTQMPNSKYNQDIYAGGWPNLPTFDIYMQPLEDDPWPCIWKDP